MNLYMRSQVYCEISDTYEEGVKVLIENINGIELKFETSTDVFSPKNIDRGTLAMLSVAEFKENDKVLDLGCGYGVVGILAARTIGQDKVTMVDIDDMAVDLSKRNAQLNGVPDIKIFQSDGFGNIKDKEYTAILSNPPYHTDFSVPKAFIEKGFNRLQTGGRLYMVTKRKDWYYNKLKAIFGGLKLWEIDGYYVFMAIKKGVSYANVKK